MLVTCRWSVSGVLLLSLLLSGCQGIPVKKQQAFKVSEVNQPSLFQRGIVSQTAEGVLRFRPCFARYDWLLTDPTERLHSRFSEQLAPTVYGEFSLRPGVDSQHWQVQSIHVLGGGKATCRFPLNGIKYRAAGGRDWVADVTADAVIVQDYARRSRWIFPVNQTDVTDTLAWQGEMKDRTGKSIQFALELQSAVCRDAFAGEYEFQAELHLDKRTLTGCARSGDLAQRTLPGHYLAELKVANTPGRRIDMLLFASGNMELQQHYLDQQPPVLQQGQWSLLPTGKLLVQIDQTNGRPDSDLLLFSRNNSGQLVLEGFNASYGENQLQLKLIGPDPEQLWHLGVQ
ncbi:hypothetical protein ACFVYJ_03765 [Pontibacter sp. JAM-7]|uniref:hypothetical protein n=1 Tax=Pontibacter sp. JAM-7 TaxID=3366581 RepID=UPI003AF81414